MSKLSIVVPVYNTNKYLKQCVDSILSQKYADMEILLVDDGSTDGSAEICDTYQRTDHRVKVLHQKNKGCICARLCGIQNSTGDYIGFVDSDDWIAEDMYQVLMAAAEEKRCDIVSMGYTMIYQGEEKKKDDATLFGLYEKGKNLDTLLSNMMYDPKENRRGVHPALCSKIIRRELLMDAFEEIDENITMGEDAAVFYPCCLRAESIFIMKEYKYYYRIHDESMCRTMGMNTIFPIYSFYQYMQRILSGYEEKYNLQEQLKQYLGSFIVPWLNTVFSLQIDAAYLFPYFMIDRGTDIILYGAGKVGRAYYNQISENRYCNIVAWADKNGADKDGTIRPEQIQDFDYCRIVVAVANKRVAEEIADELAALGVEKERILWTKPQEMQLTFS